MADPFATLSRLRRLAADQARRDLAATLAAERDAEGHLVAVQAALAIEAAAAPTDATHPLAGAYAAWLPAAQAQRASAVASVRAASADVASSQAALAEARAAARAVDVIIEERADVARRSNLRRQQSAADDRLRKK